MASLDAYSDDEADPSVRAGIERHLLECHECSESLKAKRALRSVMRSGALYFDAPGGLEARVRGALRDAGVVVTPRRMVWRHWMTAAASVLVATTLTWVLMPRGGPSADDRL